MKYDDEGRELPDPVPMAIPAGMRRPESLIETMRRLIRTEFSKDVGAIGYETFEEANDFDVEDDDAEVRESVYERMQDETPAADARLQAGNRPRDREGRRPDDDARGDDDEDEGHGGRRRAGRAGAAEDEADSEGPRGRAGKPQQRSRREAAGAGERQRPTPPRLGPDDDEGDDFDDD